VAQAIELWEVGGRRELELQCRILARQTPDSIGRIMRLPGQTVATYGELFFAIADRIDARSYIVHQVIRMPPTEPPNTIHVMMGAAYFHGPHAVDAWFDYLDHSCEVHDLQTPEGRRRRAVQLQMRALSLTDDEETHGSLVKTSRLVLGNRRKTAAPVVMKQVLANRASKTLDFLPWSDRHDRGIGRQSPSDQPCSREESARFCGVA
jgi:hypothetical protein